MRLRSSLLLFSSTLAVLMAAAFAILVFAVSVFLDLRDLENAAFRATANWTELNRTAADNLIQQQTVSESLERLDEAQARFDANMEQLDNHPAARYLPEAPRENLERTQRMWDDTSQYYENLRANLQELIDRGVDDAALTHSLMGQFFRITQAGVEAPGSFHLREVRDETAGVMYGGEAFGRLIERLSAQLQAVTNRAVGILFGAVGGGLLLIVGGALVASLVFGKRFSQRIGSLEHNMNNLAERRLTRPEIPKGADEITELSRNTLRVFDSIYDFVHTAHAACSETAQLSSTLRESGGRSAQAAETISSGLANIREKLQWLTDHAKSSTEAVQSISGKVEELTSFIQDQASAISNANTSVSAMSESVKSVAERTRTQQNEARELHGVIETGGKEVETTRSHIESIGSTVKDVHNVIEIMRSTAEQTRLLALNASIEAANAPGDTGKGFAVVAGEIRDLSGRTDSNSTIVEQSLQDITTRVKQSAEASERSSQAFGRIRSHTESVLNELGKIAADMDDLAKESNRVLAESGDVSERTERVVAGAREIETATERIQGGITALGTASDEILSSTSEIEEATEAVASSLRKLNTLTEESSARLSELDQHIHSFELVDYRKEHENGSAFPPTGSEAATSTNSEDDSVSDPDQLPLTTAK